MFVLQVQGCVQDGLNGSIFIATWVLEQDAHAGDPGRPTRMHLDAQEVREVGCGRKGPTPEPFTVSALARLQSTSINQILFPDQERIIPCNFLCAPELLLNGRVEVGHLLCLLGRHVCVEKRNRRCKSTRATPSSRSPPIPPPDNAADISIWRSTEFS